MAIFKLVGMAALLSTVIVSPLRAQQAAQEPGAAAFYQSLGVGSQNYSSADALASAPMFSSSVAPPVKRHVRRSLRH